MVESTYCPKCNQRVEKLQADNHLICDTCNYEFCWVCRGACTPYHFLPFNPLGCGSEKYAPYRHPCARVMLKIVYILLFIICFPLLVIVFLPSALAWLGAKAVLNCMLEYSKRQDDYNYIRSDSLIASQLHQDTRSSYCSPVSCTCLVGWLVALVVGSILFCVGMMLNIVLVPIFLVIFLLVLLPLFLISQCKENMNNSRQADQAINELEIHNAQ